MSTVMDDLVPYFDDHRFLESKYKTHQLRENCFLGLSEGMILVGGIIHDDLAETKDVDEASVSLSYPPFKSLLMRDSLLSRFENKTGFMQRTS